MVIIDLRDLPQTVKIPEDTCCDYNHPCIRTERFVILGLNQVTDEVLCQELYLNGLSFCVGSMKWQGIDRKHGRL